MITLNKIIERDFTDADRNRVRSRIFFWRRHISHSEMITPEEALDIIRAAGYKVGAVNYRAPTTGFLTAHFVANKAVKSLNHKNIDLHCYVS